MAVEKRGQFTKRLELEDEQGQAIFELMVFLPIFLFLFVVVYTIGNSINISINQEKATRRYFYYAQRGNSFLPRMRILKLWRDNGIAYSGIAMMGYRETLYQNKKPVAYCLKLPSLLSGQTDETCEEPTRGEQQTSFIRFYTAYGVCGETYRLQNGQIWIREYSNGTSQNKRVSETSCSLTKN